MPEAPALPKLGQAIIDLAPLLRCQDFRCVAKCLREAFARRVSQGQLLGSQRLDGCPVNGWLS